jgi:metacaspase-1
VKPALKALLLASPDTALADWQQALGAGLQLEALSLGAVQASDKAAITAQALQTLLALQAHVDKPDASLLRQAGQLHAWCTQPALRAKAREALAAQLRATPRALLFAQGLAAVVAYDTLLHPDTRDCGAALQHLVLLDCPLGAASVRACFGGRLSMPPLARLTQLHTGHALSQRLTLRDAGFVALDAPAGLADLGAVAAHWGGWLPAGRASLHPKPAKPAKPSKARKPRRRALLVGVNEYLDPATSELKGCVNDAWLISALLQESGFVADEIRMVLNHRATAAGLRDRLDWLVDGAQAGDTCLFYFSGHGAQLPLYGSDGQHVEAVHESLVPYDFDWSRRQAFSDQQFAALYSQLPYELNFVALFDCCHSGGLTRSGSQRVRGLSPPDDVRHRMLRWDAAREMWLPRRFDTPGGGIAERQHGRASNDALTSTHRMGLAQTLRADHDRPQLKKLAAQYSHLGPYMPTLLYACADAEFAYEYEHGPISHGAFSYSLVKRLRAARRQGKRLSFEQLVSSVRQELAQLGYAQTPQLVAPSHIRGLDVPLSA